MSIELLTTKEKIAKRVAQELGDGDVVNLGIGLPTLVSNFISPEIAVYFHSENGLVGANQVADKIQPNLVNAGGIPSGIIDGGAYVDSLTSFSLIRGGHIDTTVLGALEVDEMGNLANWMIPNKMVPGMGGAMDLVVRTPKVIIAMEHVAKNGAPKILKNCRLPLTAEKVVTMIITDLAVFEFIEDELTLIEISEDSSLAEIFEKTEARFKLSKTL